jgi:toxin HigB-1
MGYLENMDGVPTVSHICDCPGTGSAQEDRSKKICRIAYSFGIRWFEMIKSFRHKGLKKFFESGLKAGIQPKHVTRLTVQLTALHLARSPKEMNVAGWDWHPLKDDLEGLWAVRVNGNWRLTFGFEGEDAIVVDYQDYH